MCLVKELLRNSKQLGLRGHQGVCANLQCTGAGHAASGSWHTSHLQTTCSPPRPPTGAYLPTACCLHDGPNGQLLYLLAEFFTVCYMPPPPTYKGRTLLSPKHLEQGYLSAGRRQTWSELPAVASLNTDINVEMKSL